MIIYDKILQNTGIDTKHKDFWDYNSLNRTMIVGM